MKTQRWQDWTNALLGVWLVIAPFSGVGPTDGVAAINSYLIGTAVALFAFAALATPQIWKEYTNVGLGLWLVFAPFILGFTGLVGPMLNQIVVGLVIGSIALGVTLMKTIPMEGHDHGHGHA